MTSFRALASASLVAMAACSGAASSDLFGDPPTTTTNTSKAEPTASAAPAAPDDAGRDANGMTPSHPDAGSKDAGPTWKSPGIFCGGTTYCKTGSQLCCAALDPTFEDTFTCVAASKNSCTDGAPLRCDDRSDCAGGEVCCAVFVQGSGYQSAQCQPSCTGSSAVRLCDPKAPIDECAAAGKTCTPSQSLTGFYFCD